MVYLIAPSMEIHHKILSFGIPVSDFAFVTVWIPSHLLRNISVLLVLGEQLIISLSLQQRTALQGLPENHRGLARPEKLYEMSI